MSTTVESSTGRRRSESRKRKAKTRKAEERRPERREGPAAKRRSRSTAAQSERQAAEQSSAPAASGHLLATPRSLSLRLTAEPVMTETTEPTSERGSESAKKESAVDPFESLCPDRAGVLRTGLPHRELLEARFGRALAGLEVVSGPAVSDALDTVGARAAERDGTLYLRSADETVAVVAHEVAHALQRSVPATTTSDNPAPGPHGRVLPAGAAAEREASRLAIDGGRPVRTLPAGTVALLRRGEVGTDTQKSTDAALGKDSGAEKKGNTTEPKGDSARTPAEPSNSDAAKDTAGDPAAADGGQPAIEPTNPAFAPPPMPETKLSPDEQAKRDAELAAAKEKMEGAESGKDLVGGFADAPPSLKAASQGQLEQQMGSVVGKDQAKFEKEMPAFDVEMGGELDEGEIPEVKVPEAGQVELEKGQPKAAEKPDLPPTEKQARFKGNNEHESVLDKLFSFFGFGRKAVEEGFDEVKTKDDEIETSAGKPPEVPMEKGTETDPERIEEQNRAGLKQGRGQGRDAQQAVLDGPGPEQAKLKQLKEERSVGELVPLEKSEMQAAGGAETFQKLELEEEVKARFDLDQGASMKESLQEARQKTEEAESKRDTDRKAKVDEAANQRKEIEKKADDDQRAKVLEARTEIQKERQGTINAQNDAVKQLEKDAETERSGQQGKIETRVKKDEGLIEGKYEEKEGEAQGHVKDGEKKAEKAKKDEEEEAEKKSWWDRAANWVKEKFAELTKLVADIFDGVRKLVKQALDAARKFAKDLIDKAAKFVKDAIEAFGEALKGLVNTLLKDTFPGLAKKLNDAIDKGVAVAKKAVDAVADELKKGVDALVDALQKGLDAIIAAFQAALNFAMGLIQAALSGDWGAVFKMLLEAALKLLGIDPKEFYAFVAKVQETLGLIVEKPGQFLSNVLGAVKLGFSLFADNFLKHLKAGIIGWLTGSLGGDIQIPKKFDLLGVLDLVRQLLGFTWEWLKKRAAKVIGQKNVERLEFLFSYVDTLRKEGWEGFLKRIKGELAGLKDKILGEIGQFVAVQVIKAGVLWLASLFNPVGALVKVVMTVWNIYTFLRDQLQRIIEVVKTVVGALDKIARGVIDAAGKKVESVLGLLVPVAIDLIAKLLGLTGVTAGVKKILRSVNLKVTKVVDKVLAKVAKAFKGKGKGKKGKKGKKDGKAGAAGAIKIGKPMTVKGGGEKHTLFIKVVGKDAKVMMRSEEQTVTGWIGKLDRDFGEETKDWDQQKKKTAKSALDTARKLTKGLDDEADDLLKAKIRIAEQPASAKTKGTKGTKGGTSDGAVLSDQQKLDLALEKLLDLFGSAASGDLVTKYRAQLDKMSATFRDGFEKALKIPEIAKRWGRLSWSEIQKAAVDEPKTYFIKSPFKDQGVARRARRPALVDIKAQFEKFGKAAWKEQGDKVGDKKFEMPDRADKYIGHWVFQQLGSSPSKPLDAIRKLIFAGAPVADWVGAIEKQIQDAAENYVAEKLGGKEIDPRVKAITGKTVLPFLKAMARNAPYGSGKKKIEADEFAGLFKAGSAEKRWLSAKFRDIDTKKHEWIAAELTARVIKMAQTAKGMEAGAVWVNYQNNLRSPTEVLIFKPTFSKRVVSLAPADKKAGGFETTLKPAKVAALPTSGTAVVLQGHPGAVYAPVDGTQYRSKPSEQSEKHRSWHNSFRDAIKKDVDGFSGLASIKKIVEGVSDNFGDHVWDPDSDALGGGEFPHYFQGRSATSGEVGHDALVARQKKAFATEKAKFDQTANQIISQIKVDT